MELLQLLAHPDREFSPIPFWFLNGNLTHAELRRQLRDFCEHGVYGVVLHPRIGIPKRIGYLSKEYFSYIRTAVQTAAELEMKIVLYDEGMYPSGSANGQVTQGRPELVSQGIALVSAAQPGDEVLTENEQGTLVVRKSGGTIRGIHWGEDDGEPNAPESADILNPEVVQRFLHLTHDAYYHELHEYFGTTIIGFFTDEPSILGRNTNGMFPWTKGFAHLFTEAGGELSKLTALFTGEENADTRLYHQMILDREGSVYYAALSNWCEEHGIALMGHPHQSDDIEVERYFGIPGQDLCLRWIAPEKDSLTGLDSTLGKCSADAARLMHRRRNSNECFGACNRDNNPWQLSGGDIKWYTDWLAVRGVNLFIPHAFYYSIAGKRKEERPPDVGPNSSWWPYYTRWSGYMSRLSCLMTDTQSCIRVAVPCRNRALVPEAVRPLFEHQVGFQYLPQSMWEHCTVQEGKLYCEGMRFDFVLGEAEHFPGVPQLSNDPGALCKLADCVCTPAAPDLRCAHFIRSGTECWFLVNEGETDLHTSLTLPTQSALGQYDLWQNVSCKVRPAADRVQSFSLDLPHRGSILLFTCTDNEYDALPVKQEQLLLPTPEFTLQSIDYRKVKKTYTAALSCNVRQSRSLHPILALDAEEMAELWVNGQFAGASFWSTHRFDLHGLLKEGINELKLIVTGSLANRYGKQPVWYGLQTDRLHK